MSTEHVLSLPKIIYFMWALTLHSLKVKNPRSMVIHDFSGSVQHDVSQ